jgi:hypothetical protein
MEADAGQAVLGLDHDPADALIGEQRQELRAGVVDTGPHLFDHRCHLVPACGAVGDQSLRLALQVARALRSGHPRVDRHTLTVGA